MRDITERPERKSRDSRRGVCETQNGSSVLLLLLLWCVLLFITAATAKVTSRKVYMSASMPYHIVREGQDCHAIFSSSTAARRARGKRSKESREPARIKGTMSRGLYAPAAKRERERVLCERSLPELLYTLLLFNYDGLLRIYLGGSALSLIMYTPSFSFSLSLFVSENVCFFAIVK